MTIQTIPTQYKFTCDGCSKEVTQTSNSRPKHWADLHIKRDAYDFHDCAVADASVQRLLCDECSGAVFAAVNASMEEIRSKAAQAATP